jgi:hypothetical protein
VEKLDRRLFRNDFFGQHRRSVAQCGDGADADADARLWRQIGLAARGGARGISAATARSSVSAEYFGPAARPATPGTAAKAFSSGAARRSRRTGRDAEAHPNRIEMTIDSLANHMLSEPIPIIIDPLDEAAFTAAVRNVDIVATGNNISEALVLLKEQIEFIYDDLNRQQDLSAEQKTMLQILHTYIPPRSTKPEWL